MAVGSRTTWAGSGRLPEGLIYPELVHSGMVETLVQNTNAFNAASQNAIRLVTQRRLGDFAQESFFKNINGLVARRDPGSTADATASAVPKDELVSVKLNRIIGPVDQTFDSFRKVQQDKGGDPEVLSFYLGEQVAKSVQVDQLDTAVRSGVAALANQSAVLHTAASTLTTADLVSGLANYGDAASRIVAWVMHSKTFYDLVQSQIVDKIDGIANFNIATATPVTLNRPVLVTDSAALINSAVSPTTYNILGLTADGLVVEDSEEELITADVITGKNNIIARMQGEFAFNMSVKGFAWDATNGGINPTDAALATGSNWDPVMDSHKDFAGVIIQAN